MSFYEVNGKLTRTLHLFRHPALDLPSIPFLVKGRLQIVPQALDHTLPRTSLRVDFEHRVEKHPILMESPNWTMVPLRRPNLPLDTIMC